MRTLRVRCLHQKACFMFCGVQSFVYHYCCEQSGWCQQDSGRVDSCNYVSPWWSLLACHGGQAWLLPLWHLIRLGCHLSGGRRLVGAHCVFAWVRLGLEVYVCVCAGREEGVSRMSQLLGEECLITCSSALFRSLHPPARSVLFHRAPPPRAGSTVSCLLCPSHGESLYPPLLCSQREAKQRIEKGTPSFFI